MVIVYVQNIIFKLTQCGTLVLSVLVILTVSVLVSNFKENKLVGEQEGISQIWTFLFAKIECHPASTFSITVDKALPKYFLHYVFNK